MKRREYDIRGMKYIKCPKCRLGIPASEWTGDKHPGECDPVKADKRDKAMRGAMKKFNRVMRRMK